MGYRCFVKGSGSDEISIAAREVKGVPEVRKGAVLLEVERSVIDVASLDRMVYETGEPRWRSVEWCGLQGRVVQVEGEAGGLQVGGRASAIGPAASAAALPVWECLPVPDSLDADQAACWALLITLLRSIKRLQIEIGESVLVLGGELVGCLAAQLAMVAGAGLVVVYGPGRQIDGWGLDSRSLGPAPEWVVDRNALVDALPGGKADVLVDTWGDSSQLADLLLLVREGGRALSLAEEGAALGDFDFYPNIHRRSLKLTSSTLCLAGLQDSDGPANYAQEAEFLGHLLQGGRVDALCGKPARVDFNGPGEWTLPTAQVCSVIIQWKSQNRANEGIVSL